MSDLQEASRVTVNLAGRSYDIHVGEGLLSRASDLITPFLSTSRTIIVTDENVAMYWLAPVQTSLESSGVDVQTIVLPAGEATKSYSNLEYLVEFFLNSGIERHSAVIALGGGVIGDLVGFAAAITLRGINFIQIPTTLLAQVDSSVGGKTAINSQHGKNLVGAFHQPKLVLADLDTLKTLPDREVLAGYAEVVKYGLIRDAGFFEWLEINGKRLLQGDLQSQRHAVAHSCEAKAVIVTADERESNIRALLNFGHTFAHALEAQNAYGPALLHGEAVSIGSVLAMRLSERLGVCAHGNAERLQCHLRSINMMTEISDIDGAENWDADTLLDHMGHDKKVQGGKLTFILARDIGDAYISSDVENDDVVAILEASLKAG